MRENPTIQSNGPQAVNVFVAYDHPEAGVRAEALCELLGQEGECDCRLSRYCYGSVAFSADHPAQHEEALKSDILVVAWAQPEPLPGDLLNWLRLWALSRQVPDATLAALPVGAAADSAVANAAINQLRHLAAENELTFVCDWTDGLGKRHDDFFGELRQREQTVTPTLAAILEDSHFDPHMDWGLND